MKFLHLRFLLVNIFVLSIVACSGNDHNKQYTYFYYKDSTLRSYGKTDSMGIRNGFWKYYYSNGNPKAGGNFTDGKKTWFWVYFDSSANAFSWFEYDSLGQFHGVNTYSNFDQNLVEKSYYEHGRLIKKFSKYSH